jgi:hypothetical protein
MISAVEFKKDISKTLGSGLRSMGFKGSGFRFSMESDDFAFVIGIQASQYGGHCYIEFGIQPKALTIVNGQTIDMAKIKYFECEFRMRLRNEDNSDQWAYAVSRELNQQIAHSIIEAITKQVTPIISKFKEKPFILDEIEVGDLANNYKNIPAKLGGMGVMTGEIRLAWALTKLFGKSNPEKAKQFAAFGLSKLGTTNLIFGRIDFENALAMQY